MFTTDCVIGKCVRAFGSEEIHWPAKGTQNEDRTSPFVSVSWRPHFPGATAYKVLLTVFFDVQGPLLLNSSSTKDSLLPMCTVRQSKAYADQSKTKDRSCSRTVWFCSMIMHVHTCSVSHKWKGPILNWSSLTIHPTVRTCSPVIFRCLVPWKKHLKGQRFNSDDELKDAVKDSLRPQKF